MINHKQRLFIATIFTLVCLMSITAYAAAPVFVSGPTGTTLAPADFFREVVEENTPVAKNIYAYDADGHTLAFTVSGTNSTGFSFDTPTSTSQRNKSAIPRHSGLNFEDYDANDNSIDFIKFRCQNPIL